MNFFHILSEIEKVDPEVYERLDSRRSVFKNMGGLGRTLTAAALPLALGAIFNKAYAQTSTAATVLQVLNYALKLEYLETTFYNLGIGTTSSNTGTSTTQSALRGQYSATNLSSLDLIRVDENNHVNDLIATIKALGGIPINAPSSTLVLPGVTADFDFTGGKGTGAGPFSGASFVFSNPAVFLGVAQSLEDTGVRAYKGGATALMSNQNVLTTALNIHSVEARHASRLRTMRRGGVTNNAASSVAPTNPNSEADRSASPKSWVSGKDGGGAVPSVTAPIYGPGADPTNYPGEDNITQGGVALSSSTLTATSGFPALSYSEAFDEPLDMATVVTIAKTFATTTSKFFDQ
ncbi:ferritin-like domain-containing protein [Hymenobacter sp. BRD67]|uniref:ferritin-like domain-containing protein n=1 Tax=Hymenobacter sp. BRD67 TaxID=2675877 RepID=UPI0015654DCD|nr:ferritin-like domain-containing protein [Hymenobacter sp. BRD67]QKG53670.1 ferritin-like domain-containing protein [Hymenobacter sp. BRD67]